VLLFLVYRRQKILYDPFFPIIDRPISLLLLRLHIYVIDIQPGIMARDLSELHFVKLFAQGVVVVVDRLLGLLLIILSIVGNVAAIDRLIYKM